jgi:hypothetical protein
MGHNLHRGSNRHQTVGFGRTGQGQLFTLQARRRIAALRKARPGIIIEIRWCPALKGIVDNEKAESWAKIAAEEPDARGVEWLSSLD